VNLTQLSEQERHLLHRIYGERMVKGDSEAFMKLLNKLEMNALTNSRYATEEVKSRWLQGESRGYEALQKLFHDAWNQ
jgi:hypothetical protein